MKNELSSNKQYEKRGYLNDDFRIFYLEDLAPREIEYHYHDFDKILVFFKGNITYNGRARIKQLSVRYLGYLC